MKRMEKQHGGDEEVQRHEDIRVRGETVEQDERHAGEQVRSESRHHKRDVTTQAEEDKDKECEKPNHMNGIHESFVPPPRERGKPCFGERDGRRVGTDAPGRLARCIRGQTQGKFLFYKEHFCARIPIGDAVIEEGRRGEEIESRCADFDQGPAKKDQQHDIQSGRRPCLHPDAGSTLMRHSRACGSKPESTRNQKRDDLYREKTEERQRKSQNRGCNKCQEHRPEQAQCTAQYPALRSNKHRMMSFQKSKHAPTAERGECQADGEGNPCHGMRKRKEESSKRFTMAPEGAIMRSPIINCCSALTVMSGRS